MELIENIKYFLLCQKYHWKELFVYRSQALVWLIVGSSILLFTYLPVTIIYNVSSGIPGWTYFQLLLLSSTSGFVMELVWYFVLPWGIVNGMRVGEFDKYLIRPFGKVTCMLSGYAGNLVGITGVIGSLFLIIYCLINLNIQIIPIVIFFVSIIIGIIALVMVFLLITILSYKLMNSANFTNNLMNLSLSANTYPLNIYGSGIQLIFTLILPIGLAVYYPTQVLFSMTTPLFTLILIFVFAIIIIITKIGFNKLIKSYSSGGG